MRSRVCPTFFSRDWKVVMQMWNDDSPFVVVTVTFNGTSNALPAAMSEGESSQWRGGASSKSRAISYYSFLPLISRRNLLPIRDERDHGMPNTRARPVQRNRTWTRD